MLRLIALFVLSLGVMSGGWARGAEGPAGLRPHPLSGALAAAGNGRWDRALMLARRAGPAASDLIEWRRLRAGLGTPAEVLRFLRGHPDWPGLRLLRRAAEGGFADADTDAVLRFFDGHPPQTGLGVLIHARALLAQDKLGDAQAGVVLAWRDMNLSPALHRAFLDAFPKLLRPHHAARLRAALWRGWNDLDQMQTLVDGAAWRRAQAVQDIRDLTDRRAPLSKVQAVLAPLGKDADRDAGIAHALFMHAIRTGGGARAVDILLRQSRLPGGLERPEAWAGWRRYLARSELQAGRCRNAYDLAAQHGALADDGDFADLEWLAGYAALTCLHDPARALPHFRQMQARVGSPISLGRAGYWIGRAQQAMGLGAAARASYAQAAQQATSFYGLLAAGRAGVPVDAALRGDGAGDDVDWRQAAFTRSDLLPVVQMARAEGLDALARQFLLTLAGAQDRAGLRAMAAMLRDWQVPWLQVELAKNAALRGVVLPAPYYPLHPMARLTLPVPPELALSIARRESEFNGTVISPAGARGLMQLMPGTARDMAHEQALPFDEGRLTDDWRYNVRLGSAYLAHLVERFGGNPVLVAAAYNAGPTRVAGWIESMGDPRDRDAAGVVDWIEDLPFRETRNYVMRVTESLPIYRARLGRAALPQPFAQELRGGGLAAPEHP